MERLSSSYNDISLEILKLEQQQTSFQLCIPQVHPSGQLAITTME